MSKNKTATQVPSDAAASPVQQIAIDGTSYNLADLTDTARQHLVNVRLVDQELARLQRLWDQEWGKYGAGPQPPADLVCRFARYFEH